MCYTSPCEVPSEIDFFMLLYNSLSRQKEVFVPADNNRGVQMYVCGPTVYDFAHLGNARAIVVFDVLFRVLQKRFGKVTYVRNITDVDDKIYAASCAQNCSVADIARRFEDEFLADMRALSVLDPTHAPHATEFIPQIIAMIDTLIHKGAAYEAEGHVLFSVSHFPTYGALSRKSQAELLAGARVDVATYKRHPSDFVLWKPSEGNWPGWNSPWGFGRPGWHIECSAMSSHYFGSTFDIHGGGIDLIFPHHENERAQSCCAYETPEIARFWLHNGHLTVQGKKMSKSLGNFQTVRELRESYHPEILRYALMTAHYRQPLDWTADLLAMSRQVLNRWYRALAHTQIPFWEPDIEIEATLVSPSMRDLVDEFDAALDDDLNTPLALQKLNKMIQEMQGQDVRMVARCGHELGLFYQSAETWFHSSKEDVEDIEQKIQERQVAKTARDFQRADAIRKELQQRGIFLEDSPQGTTWRRG